MHSANFDSTISRRQAIKIMGFGAATTMAASSALSRKTARSQTAQLNSE